MVDVLNDPSYENPKMAFNNGQVSDGHAVVDSSLPNIPGPQSSWAVTEWSQTAYLQPTQLIANDSSLADPIYGTPLYSWQSATGLTALSVYSQNGAATGGSPYVYSLDETAGDTTTGSDLFLQSNPSSLIPMNNPLTLSLSMKVSRAIASYDGSKSEGLVQVFAGFSMVFNAPGTTNYISSLPTTSALMQIGIVNSDGNGAAGTENQYLSSSGNSIVYQYTPPEDPTLPFQATSGGPTELTYDVNDVLDAMINLDTSLPAQATNLSDWEFAGFYIGEEVGGTVSDPLSVGVQLSNLNLQTDPSQTVNYEIPQSISATDASVVATTEVAQTLFSIDDTSLNGTTTAINVGSYTGPLSFMSHGDAYSYNGSDNVTLSAMGASNPLIATGSGDDTLVGSSTGHSTLDAGTGINIDVDGGNQNTTFVQNNYLPGQTWDFIKGWGGNDIDIFFGYIPGLSKITVASGGLGNYQGATVTINPGNGASNDATFVGIPVSSLTGAYVDIQGVPSWIIWSH